MSSGGTLQKRRTYGLESAMWNPAVYHRFGAERSRPFFDLVARIGAERPRGVVDLGCGSGELTATLAGRWPGARVTGLDSLPEMIAGATAPGPADEPAENHAAPAGEGRGSGVDQESGVARRGSVARGSGEGREGGVAREAAWPGGAVRVGKAVRAGGAARVGKAAWPGEAVRGGEAVTPGPPQLDPRRPGWSSGSGIWRSGSRSPAPTSW
ncbi:hypothetical protein Asp14428_71200 [Actinoplanes sp. NBRC 14428]|nr:hypothetical protein Asp14428_71200 [Actinoplanes sp. NBRC 14428]